ncbi:MAG: hypothetical protein JXR10_17395 [Cyclobacteriaceae bacterium]
MWSNLNYDKSDLVRDKPDSVRSMSLSILKAFPLGLYWLIFGFMLADEHKTTWVMRNRKTILIILGHVVALLAILQEVKAQDSDGYIYGRVITIDDEYEGRITWGKEETFWHNYFNASKTNKSAYKEKAGNRDEDWDWTDFDWAFRAIWEDKVSTLHQFSCQFGDIQSIENVGRSEVVLTLKNGFRMKLDGRGYNDIGATIYITDRYDNNAKINWDRVEKVEFSSAPAGLRVRDAKPIYGTVNTLGKGSFTGFVQWDHDERIQTDKLDGDFKGDDLSISFSSIERIERAGRGGCDVLLKSGREYYLTGTNDVNTGNRGIIVYVPEMGRVDIPWVHFRSLDLIDTESTGPSYDDYKRPKGISGSVLTVRNEQYTGKIIYDLDEEWELETLDANDDGVAYEIPFRFVDKITPKNHSFSQVAIKNGMVLLLGEARDIDERNDGLMILDKRNQETHVKWNQIVEIKFD